MASAPHCSLKSRQPSHFPLCNDFCWPIPKLCLLLGTQKEKRWGKLLFHIPHWEVAGLISRFSAALLSPLFTSQGSGQANKLGSLQSPPFKWWGRQHPEHATESGRPPSPLKIYFTKTQTSELEKVNKQFWFTNSKIVFQGERFSQTKRQTFSVRKCFWNYTAEPYDCLIKSVVQTPFCD